MNTNTPSWWDTLKEIYVIKTWNRYMISVHPIKNWLKVAIPFIDLFIKNNDK